MQKEGTECLGYGNVIAKMTSECCYEDTVTTVADTSAVVYSAKREVLKARKLQRERAPKARVAEALAPALV